MCCTLPEIDVGVWMCVCVCVWVPGGQAALQRIFKLLDTDGTGFVDAYKFKRMGRARNGVDCTLVQAQMEINKVGGKSILNKWRVFNIRFSSIGILPSGQSP